ncbi:MAG: CPBP family intramembrane metalloprotease [Flavobacteriia bacterium]|nr:CPBP family intramembrane metalloprotease [Flavobacteriia bacterium]
MINKRKMYGIAWLTLLAFPILAIVIHFLIFGHIDFIKGIIFWEIDLSRFVLGSFVGVLFGLLIQKVIDKSQIEINDFEQLKKQLSSLNLSIKDKLFVSFCAGFGEEFFFRLFLQKYWGVWITAIIFVAIHGYFHPTKWERNKIGFTILPFILVLSFGYEYLGFWFAVATHMFYDFVIFINVKNKEDETPFFQIRE